MILLSDRFFIACIALPAAMLIGGLGLPVIDFPVRLLKTAERKLNRERRDAEDRRQRGTVFLILLLFAGAVAGIILNALFHLLPSGQIGEIALLAWLLPVGSLFRFASRQAKYLEEGLLITARQELDTRIWRNQPLLDGHAVARATIEQLAAAFAERITATLLAFVLCGWPGVIAWRLLTLMQDTYGRRGGEVGEFGAAGSWLYRLLQFLPERLAAFCWALSALVLPAADSSETWKEWFLHLVSRRGDKLMLAVAAGSGKLSLGGPLSAYATKWTGTGSARAMPADIKLARLSFAVSCAMLMCGFGVLAF